MRDDPGGEGPGAGDCGDAAPGVAVGCTGERPPGVIGRIGLRDPSSDHSRKKLQAAQNIAASSLRTPQFVQTFTFLSHGSSDMISVCLQVALRHHSPWSRPSRRVFPTIDCASVGEFVDQTGEIKADPGQHMFDHAAPGHSRRCVRDGED